MEGGCGGEEGEEGDGEEEATHWSRGIAEVQRRVQKCVSPRLDPKGNKFCDSIRRTNTLTTPAAFPCSPWTASTPSPMSSPFPSTSSVRITDSGSMVVHHTAPRDPRRPQFPGHATAAPDPSHASAGTSWKVIAAEITADVISAAILFWGAKLLYKWFDPAEAARAAEEKRQQEVR